MGVPKINKKSKCLPSKGDNIPKLGPNNKDITMFETKPINITDAIVLWEIAKQIHVWISFL